MNLDQYVLRLLAAVGFGASAFVGLLLAGAEFRIFVAVGALVGVLVFLNVLGGFARGAAALLLVWGALAYAQVLPNATAVANLEARIADMAQHANVTQPASQIAEGSQTKTLENLDDLCNRKILDASQCAAARTNVLSNQGK